MEPEERESAYRSYGGIIGLALMSVAILWILFHVVTAGIGTLPNYQQRAIHLGGALALVFLLYPGARRDSSLRRFGDLILATLSVVVLGYIVWNYDIIVESTWFTDEALEKLFGVTLLLLVLEGVRRALGWLFVGLILAFYLYAYFGGYIPGPLGHRGLSIDRLIYAFYLGENGLLGPLMGISATVVTLFLILGALLNSSGAGQVFILIAMRIGGRIRGGAGMVAVFGSAFMGMVNGSTVANVTSTGVLTIPLMKRLGFKRNLAGAIEAVASTGGQIMPPVMGPGAFLMAELLGVAYLQVVTAALVPSLLFFMALLIGVYLYALKYDLKPLPAELIPSAREAFAPFPMASLFIPIGILIYFIVNQYTIQLAVFWAIIAIVAMMLAGILLRARPAPTIRTNAEQIPVAEEAPLEPTLQRCASMARSIRDGLYDAARGVVFIAMIIAAAQIIVSLINLTGLGVTFSQMIVSIGQGNVLLSLVLTMVIAIILGMGMPTPAAYAVGAAVLAAPLINLGFDLLPAHLFLYFFASVSAITPPVAAGVFAAVAISGGTIMGTAAFAMILACSLFLIPFLFIMNPELTLQGEPSAIATALVSATIGIAGISIAAIGHCRGAVSWLPRLLIAAGALALIEPDWKTDLIGLALAGAGLALHLRLDKRTRATAVPE
ncbi:MAG: TRAP transporter fused permease subunit [Oceanibaculum nanhaiense]|uniref:TRAP transporter permease n=1 Tax=Oceanibaculum nanhaiense TaxID=1909734 RepID=UPI0025A46416|nr:TRAP transporter fused permease subunit [Oceanibaculum nanhaiense]MDM7947553.1 TRAP transporter fused permease subunit [Oceanibaculum nanhaiense]